MLSAIPLRLSESAMLIAALLACVAQPSIATATPDPNRPPAELRPLEITRPTLPEELAAEVAGLEQRVADLEKHGLTMESTVKQDAALDEAIRLAERVLGLREKHQGNTLEVVRWRETSGEPSVWYEVVHATRKLERLRRLRALDAGSRAEIASLDGAEAELARLYAAREHAQALALAKRKLSICRRTLGEEQLDTLSAQSWVGCLLQSQGQLAQAEQYWRQALEGYRRTLGAEHPETLNSIAWLARLLRSQRRLCEAEPYYRQALEGYCRVLGAEHPETLTAASNLGILLMEQRRLGEAEPYYRQTLEGRRRVLGEDHASTLTAVNNMGVLLHAQGRLAEAGHYWRLALEGQQRLLGEDHPNTLTSCNNLGSLFEAQGQLVEAEQYYRRALEGRRRTLGANHPETLMSLSRMGSLLRSQGRLPEAEAYCRQALDGQLHVLGADHPETLESMNRMGLLLVAQGRLAEAEPYYRQALEGHQRVYGAEHPSTLTLISNMGALLAKQGWLSEAEPYLRQALDLRSRVLGAEHLDTLSSIAWMGYLFQARGQLSEAEPYWRQVLEGRRRVLGDSHPDTLSAISSVGALLQEQGRYTEAEMYLLQALEDRQYALGDEHPDTLASLQNMGILLAERGRLSEAEPYLRQALEGRKRVLGVDHPETLRSLDDMGVLLELQGRLAEAEPYYRQALEGTRRVLGEEHPAALAALNNMGALLFAQHKPAEAERCLRRVAEISRRALGAEHPRTLATINSLGRTLAAQGRLADAEPLYRETLAAAERLRVDVVGGLQERAAFAGRLRLSAIAAAYCDLLIEDKRFVEALAVAERGRARAALDLLSREEPDLIGAARANSDTGAAARLEQALKAEAAAQTAVRAAEWRLPVLRGQRKACEALESLTDTERATKVAEFDQLITEADARVTSLRRQLGEKAAAVFAEIRHLIPAAEPLQVSEIQSALATGEMLLSIIWTDDLVAVLAADRNGVQGWRLSKGPQEVQRLEKLVMRLREPLAKRPSTARVLNPTSVAELREALLPAMLQATIADAATLIVVPDGPLHGIPFELLTEDKPIAYAPSATVAMDRRRAAARARAVAARAVVIGDPDFGGGGVAEPKYPEGGVLLAMVQRGSNAAAGGLRRGDVLLSYAEQSLRSVADLGPAIAAASKRFAGESRDDSSRPVVAGVWRDGETFEARLAVGRLGIVPSPASPASGLRSMAFFDQAPSEQWADATALDQIRLHGGSLRPLPGTRREAGAIAELLDQAGVEPVTLLGGAASAPRLRNVSFGKKPPRILHLATHGLTGNADHPEQASLALARPDKPTPDDIGFLTLDELFQRWLGRLDGTELVVLSACDTGRGVQRGGSMMTLPLGFFAAGAETVIASLWKVDDTATSLLMTRFYENLLGTYSQPREVHGRTYVPSTPMPKLAALDEAKRWLRHLTRDEVRKLQSTGPLAMVDNVPAADRGTEMTHHAAPDATSVRRPYEHPYYWSAFVLYGDSE